MKKSNIIMYIIIGIVLFGLGVLVGKQLNESVDTTQTTVVDNEADEPSDNNLESEDTNQEENDAEEVQSDDEQLEEKIPIEESNDVNSEELSSSLTIEKVRDALNLDKEYSKISISPDGKNAAYIDFVSFEALGNAYIYDSLNRLNITELTYEQPDTVKDILWLDNETVALIIGYRNGTVTQGGSIYVYTYPTKQLRLVFASEEKMEYTQIELNNENVRVKQVKWMDDNLTEYVYEDIILSVSEFK